MTDQPHNARVLVIDDDPEHGQSLARWLRDRDYSCELIQWSELRSHTPAPGIAICGMPDWASDGPRLLAVASGELPGVPLIVVTKSGAIDDAVDAIKRGAFHYLAEPFPPDELARLVAQAADRATARESNYPSRHPPSASASEELVCESAVMRELDQAISRVAHAKAPVLVLGESGTGKERVARAIHMRGPRRGRAFVAVNTSAIPEQLLESEVFGHVRGAFTGATQARKGLLAEADGGSLLLDEIGDMPLGLQAKLLRMLQFGEARPVGSDRARHVDVRIIAATHRNLQQLSREGRFREDLRYRLNVIPLVVPPLRQRPEDIPLLAREFLEHARERTPGSPVSAISDEAMAILQRASWFGNVRELESTIERLVVLGREETINARDVAYLQAPPMVAAAAWPTAPGELWSLKRVNASYVAWVLGQTGGNKARAAEILGVDLSTLYRWQHAAGRTRRGRNGRSATAPPESSPG